MGYFEQKEFENFNGQLENIKEIYGQLDDIVKERKYFNYKLDSIEFLFGDNMIEANAYLECNLKYESNDKHFIVCFNGYSHGYLEVKSIPDETIKILEAQEFIGCSSDELGDMVEEILMGISGVPKSNDYIFEILGDTLRFDRKSSCFRGWTGGYTDSELNSRLYKGGLFNTVRDKNKEWHKQDIKYNLNMRLDALYFLGELIAEKLGGYKLLELEEEKKTADERIKNILDSLDKGRYSLLKKINEYMEDKGIKSGFSMSTKDWYSVQSEERINTGVPGLDNPRLSFFMNPEWSVARIVETILSRDSKSKKIIEAIKKNRERERHLDGAKFLFSPDRTENDIIFERDTKTYSYDDFLRDIRLFEEYKESLASKQKI